MQKYQPEFIEETQIRDILKACIPFFPEETGRYWLSMISPVNLPFLDNESISRARVLRLKKLIAEGLNSIEETGSLQGPQDKRQEEIRKIKLYQGALEYNYQGTWEELGLDPWELQGQSPDIAEMELALFTAWQKAIQTAPHQTVEEAQGKSAIPIPMTIKKLADQDLIQETEEGSNVFINQKESLEALKRAIKARGLEFPTNKDIGTYIKHCKNGVIVPYESSTIRKAFPKSERT